MERARKHATTVNPPRLCAWLFLVPFLTLPAWGQSSPNDAFTNRIVMSGPALFGLRDNYSGSNTNATKEAGEPNHAGNGGGKSVWWSWTAPANGVVALDTVGSSFDTLLAVYTGSSVTTLTLVAADNDSGTNGASLLMFSAVAGTEYNFSVDGFNGASGSVLLNIDQTPIPPINDSFTNRILITGMSNTVTGYTLGATVESGEPTPPGRLGAQSAWWTWTAPTNGLVMIELLGTCPFNSIAAYVGNSLSTLKRVAGGYHGANLPARIQFPAMTGTVYQIAAGGDVTFGGNVTLTIRQTVAKGRVIARGSNGSGELEVPLSATNVVAVAAGYHKSLALRVDGTVVGWGSGANVPAGLSNVVAISTSFDQNIALQVGGTIVRWGDSTNGSQITNVIAVTAYYVLLADGSISSLALPTAPFFINAVALADYSDKLVLQTDGTVTRWSGNGAISPPPPAGLNDVITIAAGGYVNMALRKNGTVVVWGHEGLSNVAATLSNVVASTAAQGDLECVALRSDGTAVDWFYNALPAGLSKITAIGAGFSHILAVLDAPTNDHFASRTPISGTNLVFQGFNCGASQETGEPNHSSAAISKTNSVWYEWIAPASGGVVIEANTTGSSISSLVSPIMAVYSNSTLASLGRVAECSSSFYRARVAFTAQAGLAYPIALAGSPINSCCSYDDGVFSVALQLSPSPSNDLFANRTVIPRNSLDASGSFIGASREANEPTHGPRNLPETLWWTWTAPTNTGIITNRVSIIADSVSLPPDIGVYKGTSLAALTTVPVSTVTNGMTRVVNFNALAGETFQIALAGQQHDPAGNIIATNYGNYRLRFLNRFVTLSFPTNLVSTFNTNRVLPCGAAVQAVSAQARVTNFGSAATGPLRIVLQAVSGTSAKGLSATTSSTTCDLLTNVVALSGLASNQTASATLTAAIPPQTDQFLGDGVSGFGTGWGIFATLQEQVGTNWIALDQTLVSFGNWPTLGEPGAGPGGGVIRLDPNYFNISAAAELAAVDLLGSPGVVEGSSYPYLGKAIYDNNAIVLFTNTAWSVTNNSGLSSRFSVTTNGILTVGNITSNTMVTLKAPYSSGGVLYNVTTNLFVTNLPPPALSNLKLLSKSNVIFTISGVPGRSNRVEATTNLLFNTNTVWLPVLTNAPLNGVFNFTNSIPTNVPKRFFRARELE